MSKRRYILAALLGGLISQSALAAHGRLGDDAPRLREMERMERPTPAQSRRMTPSEAAAQAQRIHGGGRVLSVVGTGADLPAARAQVYDLLRSIRLPGSHFRSDIGLRAAEGKISL